MAYRRTARGHFSTGAGRAVEGGDDRQKLNKSRDGMAGNKSKVMLKFQLTDTRLDLSGFS